MMDRSGSVFILLVVVVCSSLLLRSSHSSFQGFEGRNVLGAIDTGVVLGTYDVEGTVATRGNHKRKMMSSSSASKDTVEVMDYSDPGANVNPKYGFLGSPPPPPTPT